MEGTERVYRLLVENEEDHGRGDVTGDVGDEVPGNALKLILGFTLQKVGDRVVDAKTVLAWLLGALGAPVALVGLLVPIRESGSLLPQATLVPWVRAQPQRKWVWIAGAAGQFVAVAAMAAIAVGSRGVAAGWGILAALAVFALSRSVSSIASKDLIGRTIPKGQRGQVTGMATVASGIVAITVGAGIRLWGGDGDTDPVVLAWLLAAAATMWVLSSGAFAAVREPIGEHDDEVDTRAIGRALALLRDDRAFRRFVIARTLLLVSALTPPFVVTMATERAGASFGQLGPFIVAQGAASLLGGRTWGRLADRSSRRVMMAAAGVSAALVVAFLLVTRVEAMAELVLLYPAAYFLLALAHTGSRIGRKTYVVDLAEGNRRTDYVAVSNTAMGALLLATGALTAGLATLGPEVALVFLALLGAVGVPVARSLPEVSAGA